MGQSTYDVRFGHATFCATEPHASNPLGYRYPPCPEKIHRIATADGVACYGAADFGVVSSRTNAGIADQAAGSTSFPWMYMP